MKSFAEIMNHVPQFKDVESGAEPCLIQLIERYYEDTGMFSSAEVRRLTSEYINLLSKFAEA